MAAPVRRKPAAGKATPKNVIERLWRVADQQIAESEKRMLSDRGDAELEKEARTLSVLGKLVRELSEIELPAPARRAQVSRNPSAILAGEEGAMHGDAVDLAQFRAELAARFDALRSERAMASVAGDVGQAGA